MDYNAASVVQHCSNILDVSSRLPLLGAFVLFHWRCNSRLGTLIAVLFHLHRDSHIIDRYPYMSDHTSAASRAPRRAASSMIDWLQEM